MKFLTLQDTPPPGGMPLPVSRGTQVPFKSLDSWLKFLAPALRYMLYRRLYDQALFRFLRFIDDGFSDRDLFCELDRALGRLANHIQIHLHLFIIRLFHQSILQFNLRIHHIAHGMVEQREMQARVGMVGFFPHKIF
jgi:hypothetical protein